MARSRRGKKALTLGGLVQDAGAKTVGIHVRHAKKPKAPKVTTTTTTKGGKTATKKTTGKRKGHPESAATRAKISASLRARRKTKSG